LPVNGDHHPLQGREHGIDLADNAVEVPNGGT